MTAKENITRKIDPEKVTAERLNGYAALFGCIALIGAYATTGQIIPGFVYLPIRHLKSVLVIDVNKFGF